MQKNYKKTYYKRGFPFFFCFLLLVTEKVVLASIDFNQQTAWGAPVRWSKYITGGVGGSVYYMSCGTFSVKKHLDIKS